MPGQQGSGPVTMPAVNASATLPPAGPDESLSDWFLSLTPAQRLAELESRLAFFHAARTHGDTELAADHRPA
jgi:hypothetical protein